MKATTDYYNAISESNEGNNTRTETWYWGGTSNKPDLIVDDIWSTTTPLTPGQWENVTFRIKNTGSAAATSRFYTKLWVGSTLIGTWYANSLNAGYSATGSTTVKVSSSGNYSVKATTDYYNAISESDEGNNTRTETWTWEGAANKPNLTPYKPSGWDYPIVPSSWKNTTKANTLYAENTTYIDWAVVNNGEATASGRFYIYLYLDGKKIGSWYTENLQAGWYAHLEDWPYTISSSGNHTLKIVTDATGSVSESNEGDNNWERTFYWRRQGFAYSGLRWHADYPRVPVDQSQVNLTFWRPVITNAERAWNDAGAKFEFYDASSDNNISIVWRDSPALATTWSYLAWPIIERCRVEINIKHDFSTTYPVPSDKFDLLTVMAHEFGHWLKLDHSKDSLTLMYYALSKGVRKNLTDGDIAGIRYIYRER